MNTENNTLTKEMGKGIILENTECGYSNCTVNMILAPSKKELQHASLETVGEATYILRKPTEKLRGIHLLDIQIKETCI